MAFQELDEDKDGKIEIEQLMKLLKLCGRNIYKPKLYQVHVHLPR